MSKNLQVGAKRHPEEITVDGKEKQHRHEIKPVLKSFPIHLRGALTCMFQRLCWFYVTGPVECTFSEVYRFIAQTDAKAKAWSESTTATAAFNTIILYYVCFLDRL